MTSKYRLTRHWSLADRLAHYSRRDHAAGCLIYTGGQDGGGYGSIWDGTQTRRAHRVSWEVANGKSAKGLCILHHCDNPPCIEPLHLFDGSRRDNNLDKLAKGRAVYVRGEDVGIAKITGPQALAIYRDPRSLAQIAADYSIGKSSVHNIKTGRTWVHITGATNDRRTSD